MKTLLVILGPNGVGKSTASQVLLARCPRSAYVDSDACRAMNPFALTPATREVIVRNMADLVRNYLQCQEIDTVIFPYGFHKGRKELFEEMLGQVRKTVEFSVFTVVLTCSEEENRRRAQKDGRDADRIERGIRNTLHLHEGMGLPQINVTNLSPEATAERILALWREV